MEMKNKKDIILDRPRLMQLLDEGRDFPCTIVVAGGGYSKTQTVLSYLNGKDIRTGWIAAAVMDNHPLHFWKKLIRNLGFRKELTDFFIKQGFPEDLTSLHQFCQLFSEELYRGKEYYLVIDDFHLITAPDVLNFVESLIQLNMENFRIILLSRFEPRFYKRYLIKDMVYSKVGMKELSFTREEVREYMVQKGREASPAYIWTLFRYTKGWPLGVCFAEAYLVESSEDDGVHSMMRTEEIYQLLEHEYFNKCDAEVRKVLLKLSLLDSFTLELLRVLVPHEFLDSFSSGNQVIHIFIHYNPHTGGYQIHQIFREFLISRQGQLEAEEKLSALMSAARWYEERERLVEAQIYYWRCQNWDKVWRLILDSWKENPGYIPKEKCDLYLKMLVDMPEEYMTEHPLVKVIWGCIYGSLLMIEKAKSFLCDVISGFSPMEERAQVRAAKGEALIMLGFYSMMVGEDGFHTYFQRAASYLPNGSQIFRKDYMILNKDTVLTLKRGEAGEFESRLKALYKMAPYSLSVLNGAGFGLEFQGEAECHYYQGNMKKAEEFAYKAIYKGSSMNQVDIVCNAYFILVRIGIYNGDYREIMKNLGLLRDYAKRCSGADSYGLPDIAEGWFFARMGHIEGVAEWIRDESMYEDVSVPMSAGREMIVKGFCYLARGYHEDYLRFLNEAEKTYEVKRQYISLISIKVQKAIVFHWLDDYEGAAHYLEDVYRLSRNNSIILPLVGYGKHLCHLIEYLQDGRGINIPAEWISFLYGKAAVYSKRILYLRREYEKEQNLLSQEQIKLEQDEERILTGLYQGMTRAEIAASLSLPLPAVKYALKNIYGKLGAINGVHAVQIALVKGIISEDRS